MTRPRENAVSTQPVPPWLTNGSAMPLVGASPVTTAMLNTAWKPKVMRIPNPNRRENGGTALGLKCRDGVVLAVEKPVLNKMLLPTSNRRIHSVDEAHGVAVTGFVADARQIVNRARDEAIGYEET